MCTLLTTVLALGFVPYLYCLRAYWVRTAGQYSALQRLGWYALVAAFGVLLSVRLNADPYRCAIFLALLAGTPLYAWLDTHLVYWRTGNSWGFWFFVRGCFSELYTLTLAAQLVLPLLN